MAPILLAACALSPATIEERTPKLDYASKGTVALTVVDNRPFIVSGEKKETNEGIFRGAYGIPFAFEGMRKDDEGTPYAARIADILSKALDNAGSTANVIQTPKGSTVETAINGLRAVPFDAGLIVNVLDSRIDAGGARWSYFFDYEIIVIDHAGTIVSRKKYDGKTSTSSASCSTPAMTRARTTRSLRYWTCTTGTSLQPTLMTARRRRRCRPIMRLRQRRELITKATGAARRDWRN